MFSHNQQILIHWYKKMKLMFNQILLLFIISFGLVQADDISNIYFKVSKSLDNTNQVETGKILVTTSFNLNNYEIKNRLLESYDSDGKEGFGSETILTKIDPHHFKVEGSGIHKISLKETASPRAIVWEQWVYVPYPKPQNHYQLAQKYLPITAYSDKTQYFPQRIDEILFFENDGSDANNPNIRLKISNITGKNFELNTGSDLKDFMTEKGHADFILNFNADPSLNFLNFGRFNQEATSVTCTLSKPNCDPLFLRKSFAKTRPLTVYYTSAIINDGNNEKLYITYTYIYAFDMKTGTRNKPGPGSHALDRESLVLILDKPNNTNIWKPTSIVYGAHLESQNMNFKGCLNNNLNQCEQGGTVADPPAAPPVVANGKTLVSWNNVPKLGDHPIVYPAQGSHALFPIYGRYSITFPELNELAGNISDKYTFYPHDFELLELNYYNNDKDSEVTSMGITETEKQSAFAFSGFWVDGFGEFNSRFPPLIRSPQLWTANATPAFAACKTTTCDIYFAAAKQSVKEHAVLTGRITNIGGSIVTVSYDGSTYYETETDADGRFSLIVPADVNSTGLLITNGTNLRYIQDDPNANTFTFDPATNNGGTIHGSGRVNLTVPSATNKNIGDINFNVLDSASPSLCSRDQNGL